MNPTEEKSGSGPTIREGAAGGPGANAADFASAGAASSRRERGRDALLALLVVAGLAASFVLARRLDARRPAEDPFATYEEMYLGPGAARRLSLAFNGLASDWYW